MTMGPVHQNRSGRVSDSTTPTAVRQLEREMVSLSQRSRQLSSQLPALSELVVAIDSTQQRSLLSRIVECELAVVAEIDSISTLRRQVSAKSFSKYTSLFDEACERQLLVVDLKNRAEALFVSSTSVPVGVPLVSKKQTADLLDAFHVHRKAFWSLMYRVPAIQRHVLQELTEATTAARVPSLVVHRDSSAKVDEARVRSVVRRVVTRVDRLINPSSARVSRSNREEAAKALLTTPIAPEKLNEQMVILRQGADRLADLETRLKCDYGNVRSKAAQKDPLFPEWRDLARDFGGGALHARKLVSELARAQSPYLRIRQYLTTANLPFVKKIISYSRKFIPSKDDIVQEGALGFMHAIEKYDRKSGFALLTYAGFWVRQLALRGYERTTNMVYIPSRFYGALVKLRYELVLDPRGSDQTFGKKLGLRAREVKALRPFINEPQRIDRKAQTVDASPASLLPAREASPEASINDGMQREHVNQQIKAILGELPERERLVIMERFGLDGKGERTLTQIATEMGLTKERVRQIQKQILNRLREGGFGKRLRKIADEIE